MLGFVRDYTRPDGLAPQVGDGDDGRFLPLGDYGRADPRSHLHLFDQAGRAYEPAVGHARYGAGGYYVIRTDGLYMIVRCGDTGLGGLGAHAHNDQLSFELTVNGHPVVVDPGTFVYGANPSARNLFRSTGFHATLQVEGAEQNPIPSGGLFRLDDWTRARELDWWTDGARAVFEGRHHGFERLNPPSVHTRRIEFDGEARSIVVTDTVTGTAGRDLYWTFPLGPGITIRVDGAGAVAEFPGGALSVKANAVAFSVVSGWYSPRYGVRVPVPFLRARYRTSADAHDTRVDFSFRAS